MRGTPLPAFLHLRHEVSDGGRPSTWCNIGMPNSSRDPQSLGLPMRPTVRDSGVIVSSRNTKAKNST